MVRITNKPHLTAIKRTGASQPLKTLLKLHLLNAHQKIIDYGCGHGADVKWLCNRGYAAYGFDPYWRNNDAPLTEVYDTVLCTYVLNVVDESIRQDIIERMKELCRPGGCIYITVRRDIKKNFTTKKGTHQYVVKLNLPVVKENSSYCIYKLAR